MTQIQSVFNHDLCWDFPLFLLKNQESATAKTKALNVENRMALPRIQRSSLQAEIVKLSEECMKAIEYFHCMKRGIPPNQIIAVEWTKNAVHRVFNCPNY